MIKIIQEFLQDATTQSIHVDEVVDEQLLVSKKNLWDHSLAFFNNIVAEVKSAQLTHIKVDLQVELNSDLNILVGPPEDEESLIDSVDWVFRSDGASDFGQTVPLKRSCNYIKKLVLFLSQYSFSKGFTFQVNPV